jgi:hypothetical protein
MDNTEAFHRAMLPYGGRVAWEQGIGTPAAVLYSNINKDAEELISSAIGHVPGLPPIHFDFVYNGAVNAFAFKADGKYFIGVTSGTLVLLQLVLCRMLSDSRLFSNIGNPSGEAADLPLIDCFIPDAQSMYEAGIVIGRPRTEPRWLYSCHLLAQAALFIVGHELAHITRGHVDYLCSKTGTPFYAEIETELQDRSSLLERQAMEGDADQRSFISRIISARDTVTAFVKETPPWSNEPLCIERLIFDCTFSVNTMFRIFGDICFAGSDLSAASYPPFPLRRAMLLIAALGHVKFAWNPELFDATKKTLLDATISAETAFAAITGQKISHYGMDEAFGPEGKEHMKRLGECWFGGLRDRLKEFAYEVDRDLPDARLQTNFSADLST